VGGGLIYRIFVMFELTVVQHSDLSESILEEIIHIKSISWPYCYESQIKWMESNLKNIDLHFLLIVNNRIISYLNLIDIKININNNIINGYGVGNVCTIEKGKGYGNLLMEQTNRYISQKKRVGLLFCKKELVCFYKKFSWIQLEKNKLALAFDNNNIETMIYNLPKIVYSLHYNGNYF